MPLLGLTNYAQIRGVLTVSEADLPDETLESYGLEDDLSVDLDGWAGEWESLIQAAADPAAVQADIKKLRLLRLYAKYYCSALVATTAPVFVLKKSTDGSNEGQRSDADGFLWLSDRLLQKAKRFQDEFLEVDVDSITPVRVISRVTPSRDPVTEARNNAPQ